MSQKMSSFQLVINKVPSPEYEIEDVYARNEIAGLKEQIETGGGQRKLYYM